MKKTIFLVTVLFTVLLSNAQSYNFEQGVKAFENYDYKKALDYFNRDIKDNPKAGLSYFYCALIYNYQGKKSQALSDVSKSIKYIHPNKKNKIFLADAHRLRGDIYLKIEEYDKALKDYAAAIKITPDNPDLYTGRAQIYYLSDQYGKAETDYQKALAIDEGSLSARAGLGKTYIAQKRFDKAEEILDQLIKLSPDYAAGYYYRAKLYYEQERYDDAINDMFQVCLLDKSFQTAQVLFIHYAEKNFPLALSKINARIYSQPEDDVWYYIRAQMFKNNYDFESAIQDYTTLINLSDLDHKPLIFYYRGQCYLDAGFYGQAIRDFTEAISLDSTDSYSYGYRGDAKRLMGNYEAAVKDFTKAIEINPRQPWFYYRRGWTKGEFMGDYESALEDYNTAIAIDNDYAYTYLMRGRLYEMKLNNYEKAREDYLKILSLDTVVDRSGNCRQYALFHLKRDEEAIAWLNKIISEYPSPGNYYDATCLYSLMNKPTEAIASLELAFQNGYRDFVHLSADDDVDNIRNLPEFNELVREWKNRFEESEVDMLNDTKEEMIIYDTVKIPMQSRGTGVYEIPCKINGLGLNMIFDTGASDISVSQTEIQFMLKNGYLNEKNILGKRHYLDANGDIEVGTVIVFREVDFGGVTLKNVKATVVPNKKAPLLFGQSALSKYGKIIIDNENQMITIISKSTAPRMEKANESIGEE